MAGDKQVVGGARQGAPYELGLGLQPRPYGCLEKQDLSPVRMDALRRGPIYAKLETC